MMLATSRDNWEFGAQITTAYRLLAIALISVSCSTPVGAQDKDTILTGIVITPEVRVTPNC